MACKQNHSDPDNIPEFLCRACHPELTSTPAQRAAADAADRVRRDLEREATRKARELLDAQRDLAALEQRDLAPDSTPAKIRVGLRAKVQRLQQAA